MRGLRASRAAAALALAVMAACLAPCGVGAAGFDAAAQGRARARETHGHRRAPIAPRLTSLSPPSAHVSGGAVLTKRETGGGGGPGSAMVLRGAYRCPLVYGWLVRPGSTTTRRRRGHAITVGTTIWD